MADFHSSYRYLAWSLAGNLFSITPSEQTVTLEVPKYLNTLAISSHQVSLKNDPWAEYNAACFITNFLSFFLSLDKYHVLRVMDTQHRKELWRQELPLEAVSMVPHPRLPAALIGEFMK